ncbi:OmpA family protein [bacterium]|nr:OmpA family protein [bacterium]
MNYRVLDLDNNAMSTVKATFPVAVALPAAANAKPHVEQHYIEHPIASATTSINNHGYSIAGSAYPDMTLATLLVFSLVYLTLVRMGTLRTLKSALLVFISTCLASGPTLADVQTGLYLGIGGGASRLLPGLANATIDERDSFDSAWNTTAGYQLNRNIGVEFEYANLGTTDLDPIGHVDYQDINVSGLYHFGGVASPIGGKKYSLYGRLGAGTIRNQSNLQLSRGSSAHWLAGAGVQVPVNNNLSLRAEGVVYDADASRLGVTVVYRMDLPSLPSLGPLAKRLGFGKSTDDEGTQLADATPSSAGDQLVTDEQSINEQSMGQQSMDQQATAQQSVDQQSMEQQSAAMAQSDDPDASDTLVLSPFQFPMPASEELPIEQPATPSPKLMTDYKAGGEAIAADNVDALKMQRIEAASEVISDNSLMAAVEDDNNLLAAAQDMTAPTLASALPVNAKATVPEDALEPVHFGFDDTSVSQESKNILQPLINYLLDNPEAQVTLTGHTDSIGDADYNQILSERRARAVELFLLQQGINKKMIRLLGMGEKRPVRPNDKPAGRKSNRRVSIVVD